MNHEFVDPGSDGSQSDVDSSADVYGGVEGWLAISALGIGLGGEVEDGVGHELAEQALDRHLIDNVALDKFRGRVQIFALASSQIVEYEHLDPVVYLRIDEVRSDESGSTSHYRSGQ